MTALTGPTIRQRKPRQTPAERQAVYAYVTERDKTCRRPIIDPYWPGVQGLSPDCFGKLERHHAGNTIGTARKTDARHVILLCRSCHAYWAPSRSRLILEYLAGIEGD